MVNPHIPLIAIDAGNAVFDKVGADKAVAGADVRIGVVRNNRERRAVEPALRNAIAGERLTGKRITNRNAPTLKSPLSSVRWALNW